MQGGDKPSTPKRARRKSPATRQGAIASFIEHCQSAKAIADGEGERFLSYLLAMTLLAARELQPPTSPS